MSSHRVIELQLQHGTPCDSQTPGRIQKVDPLMRVPKTHPCSIGGIISVQTWWGWVKLPGFCMMWQSWHPGRMPSRLEALIPKPCKPFPWSPDPQNSSSSQVSAGRAARSQKSGAGRGPKRHMSCEICVRSTPLLSVVLFVHTRNLGVKYYWNLRK